MLAGEREAAVLCERREIGDRSGKVLRPHKVLDDDEIERVALQWRGAQPAEINQAHAGIGLNPIHAGIIADLPPRTSSLRCIAEVAPSLCLMGVRSTIPA